MIICLIGYRRKYGIKKRYLKNKITGSNKSGPETSQDIAFYVEITTTCPTTYDCLLCKEINRIISLSMNADYCQLYAHWSI